MEKILKDKGLTVIVMLCLTLGLAPYKPEPHIWGKLKWVWGGANGMEAMDFFDLLMHGTPWLLLLGWIIVKVKGLGVKN
ncbi:hypothetical protein [Luteibaculum oceani]|uniref:RND transporter n=1 Tax=Luteibaculum oceani TaxID=1294296 RepID=A0A5C6UVP9_9FLAO|nr:hypothetical protein [Luteibaculum oceani]TXC76216.1 hypothetical protein FRX97_10740 [Luteibaculum oceani]